MSVDGDWRSYDSVAETYDRVAVPSFTSLAHDLVSAMGLRTGATVLDVGTGTGLTAELARVAVAAHGVVVGVDPSTGMLRVAQRRRRLTAVCASVPGLPFVDASFDAVVANLVLSHLSEIALGLADMTRVLRPGGRLGLTAWGPAGDDTEDDAAQAADIVAPLRESCGIPETSPVKGVPSEELLKDRAALNEFLEAAGLLEVDINLHSYRYVVSVADHVAGWNAVSRYRRSVVDDEQWRRFSDFSAAALRDHFGDSLNIAGHAWVATGTTRATT